MLNEYEFGVAARSKLRARVEIDQMVFYFILFFSVRV